MICDEILLSRSVFHSYIDIFCNENGTMMTLTETEQRRNFTVFLVINITERGPQSFSSNVSCMGMTNDVPSGAEPQRKNFLTPSLLPLETIMESMAFFDKISVMHKKIAVYSVQRLAISVHFKCAPLETFQIESLLINW